MYTIAVCIRIYNIRIQYLLHLRCARLSQLNMAFYVYNPLAGGILTGKHKKAAVCALARAHIICTCTHVHAYARARARARTHTHTHTLPLNRTASGPDV